MTFPIVFKHFHEIIWRVSDIYRSRKIMTPHCPAAKKINCINSFLERHHDFLRFFIRSFEISLWAMWRYIGQIIEEQVNIIIGVWTTEACGTPLSQRTQKCGNEISSGSYVTKSTHNGQSRKWPSFFREMEWLWAAECVDPAKSRLGQPRRSWSSIKGRPLGSPLRPYDKLPWLCVHTDTLGDS